MNKLLKTVLSKYWLSLCYAFLGYCEIKFVLAVAYVFENYWSINCFKALIKAWYIASSFLTDFFSVLFFIKKNWTKFVTIQSNFGQNLGKHKKIDWST
jgi:hypothetical protein